MRVMMRALTSAIRVAGRIASYLVVSVYRRPRSSTRTAAATATTAAVMDSTASAVLFRCFLLLLFPRGAIPEVQLPIPMLPATP